MLKGIERDLANTLRLEGKIENLGVTYKIRKSKSRKTDVERFLVRLKEEGITYRLERGLRGGLSTATIFYVE